MPSVSWGLRFYLGSYGALQIGLLRGQGYAYATINAAAASCVLVSLWQNFNLSAALIQIFWIAISAIGIARLFVIRRRLRFTPEERDLLETVMPDMPREQARELLNLGNWFTAEPDHILTTECEPVPYLAYLAKGEAAVTTSGRQIALIKQPAFIGEITCLDGEEATGTVQLTKPSLIFTIDAAAPADVSDQESCSAGTTGNRILPGAALQAGRFEQDGGRVYRLCRQSADRCLKFVVRCSSNIVTTANKATLNRITAPPIRTGDVGTSLISNQTQIGPSTASVSASKVT